MAYQFVTENGRPAFPAIKKEMARIKKEVRDAQVIILPRETLKLADMAAKFMAQRIKLKIRRTGSTGELAESILASVRFRRTLNKGFSINVGDTSLLPDYWAMINYGGSILSGYVPGFWDNSAGGRSRQADARGKGTGEFTYQPGQPKGTGQYMMPYYPIKGFHYIMYAYARINAYLLSGAFDRKVVRKRR